MAVERCICRQISFGEILEIAEKKGLTTVEELQKEKICGVNCKLCVPYLRKVLRTGAVRFKPDFLKNKKHNS